MVRYFIIFILICFIFDSNINCEAKNKKIVNNWLPREYLLNIKSGNKDKKYLHSLIVPITTFQITGSKICVFTWGEESYRTCKLKLISRNPDMFQITGYLRFNLMDYNLKYDSTKLIYYDSKFYIIKRNDFIDLIVKNKLRTDTIVFTKYLDKDIPISDPFTDDLKFELIGNYDIFNHDNKLIETNIHIDITGAITGSNLLTNYQIKDWGINNQDKSKCYRVIYLLSIDGKSTKLYYFRNQQEDIEFYSENIYEFRNSDNIDNNELVYKFKKKQ
jgi:hypothetical protein